MTRPRFFTDSYTMFRRCLIKTQRSPEAMAMALLVPIVMMILFGYVFGGIVDIGGVSYLNFIVPGIIVQCVTNASTSTAYGLHKDMTTGIIDRFRSMSIAKSAVISGHVWVSVIRNLIIAALTIATAVAIGFRPEAGFTSWLIITGIITLFIIAITWVVIIFGLIAKDPESISGMGLLVTIMVFLSSAFTPTESLPTVLRVFAENQPMTPVINVLRSLMLGLPLNGELLPAIIWCVGITIVAFALSVLIYKSKLTK